MTGLPDSSINPRCHLTDTLTKPWSLTSWLNHPYEQGVNYPNPSALTAVLTELTQRAPLVHGDEIKQLKQAIAQAGRGDAFILQGGDCAESFADCQSDIISNKLKILLQMSVVLFHGMRKPIIRIGRIAGQYAKPRSCDDETINGVTLPSYRGDLINGSEFTANARRHNPERLLTGYECAAKTLHIIRTLLNANHTHLHHPHQWDLQFIDHAKQADEYHALLRDLSHTLPPLTTLNDCKETSVNHMDFFTSHEALHLHYEQALTRQLTDGLWYNLSTHLPWVGMRTCQLHSAHIEFLRGVQNPIAIKLGPDARPCWLVDLLDRLNPQREEGRIMLITRMGVDAIKPSLPPLIHAVHAAESPVTWSCDPMHGNTETTSDGIKTRQFDTILKELQQAVVLHHQNGSHLGGVHFELTGDNVTECIGGARGLTATDLKRAYHSRVDPRLNYEQSLEMAIQLSRQCMAIRA